VRDERLSLEEREQRDFRCCDVVHSHRFDSSDVHADVNGGSATVETEATTIVTTTPAVVPPGGILSPATFPSTTADIAGTSPQSPSPTPAPVQQATPAPTPAQPAMTPQQTPDEPMLPVTPEPTPVPTTTDEAPTPAPTTTDELPTTVALTSRDIGASTDSFCRPMTSCNDCAFFRCFPCLSMIDSSFVCLNVGSTCANSPICAKKRAAEQRCVCEQERCGPSASVTLAKMSEEGLSPATIGAIGGGVGGAFAVSSLVIALIMMYRKRKRVNPGAGGEQRGVPLQTVSSIGVGDSGLYSQVPDIVNVAEADRYVKGDIGSQA
jgi:hypothetical protein